METGAPESEDFLDATEAVFEEILNQRGNEFVEGLSTGRTAVSRLDVYGVSRTELTERNRLLNVLGEGLDQLLELMAETVERVLQRPGSRLRPYLHELADAYTLLAFLRQTPDVQRAIDHIVEEGRLVLDTTVLLPCFAETLLPEEEQRYTNLIRAAAAAGVELAVTTGVIEEIDAHLTRSMACYRMEASRWQGDEPFVLRHWRDVGGAQDFASFVDTFRGTANPLDDIRDFLSSELAVTPANLTESTGIYSLEKRGRFTELWRAKKRPWPGRTEEDVDILLRHDVEMYLGVLSLRHEGDRGVFGHRYWWVTSDVSAFTMYGESLRDGLALGSSPCMHPDFLSNLLAVGTRRREGLAEARRLLPIALNIQRFGWGIPELSDTAKRIREENVGRPEWVIRRKVRDAVDQLKGRPDWRYETVLGEEAVAVNVPIELEGSS